MAFPHTFGTQSSPVDLSDIDDNFDALLANSGSTLVGFIQTLVAAAWSARTVEDKLAETISLLDAGADPTGATPCDAAFVIAVNALHASPTGGTLYIPAGTYSVVSMAHSWPTSSAAVSVSIRGAGINATKIIKSGSTTTPVFDLSVSALGNGVFSKISDLSIAGNGLCVGIQHTLFARYQIENVAVSGCTVGINNIGSLIASYHDCHLANNQTGYKCIKSGSVYPNLIGFYGGAVFQNSSWGFDIDHGQNISINGVDIELNGTTGDTNTGGCILRATIGDDGGNGNIVFNASWFEANFGNGLKIETNNYGLSVSCNDVKFVNNQSGNHVTCGDIRSLVFDGCNANAASSIYTIGAVKSLIIRGGSIWTVNSTAVHYEYHGVVLGGSTVNIRIGGTATGLGTWNQTQNRHNSGTGNVSAPTSGTATTLFTVSGSGPRLYQVFCCLGGSGASYTATARIAWDGTNLVRMGGENASLMTITVSGTSVQATQSSGVGQTIFYVYDMIG